MIFFILVPCMHPLIRNLNRPNVIEFNSVDLE
jgi:hypothetical protein